MQTQFRASAMLALLAMTAAPVLAKTSEEQCETGQRKVSMSSRQMSFSNVDISPDGRTIVFDVLGDVYTVSSSGGTASLLVGGPSWDVRPVWSPDGNKLAFISDRAGSDQVYTIETKDPHRISQLTFEGEAGDQGASEKVRLAAEWLPDGSSLVVNGRKFPLSRARSDRLERVSETKYGSYSGNSRNLYHFRTVSRTAFAANQEVWRLERKSGMWKRVSQNVLTTNQSESPLVSSDGRWLVYIGPVGDKAGATSSGRRDGETAKVASESNGRPQPAIRVRNLVTSEDRILVGPAAGWEQGSPSRYAMSHDSRLLFITSQGHIRVVNIETGAIDDLPVLVNSMHCLNETIHFPVPLDHGNVEARNIRDATGRPDGRQIAFSALRQLYVMDLPEGKARVLLPETRGQFQPAYSPDGHWLAFASWSAVEGGHIWMVPSAGGRPERLTSEPGYYETPTWSPDGKYIAFVGHKDVGLRRSGFSSHVFGGSLHLLQVADRATKILPVEARLGNPPSFSSDGARIRYAPFVRDNESQLLVHSVSIDDGQWRDEGISSLLPIGGTVSAVPSPNGREVAVVREGNLHLIHCKEELGAVTFDAANCKQGKITIDGGYDPKWVNDGSELEWSFANTYYRASTQELVGEITGKDVPTVDAPIDRTAQESVQLRVSVPRAYGAGRLLLRGARIITLRGEEVLENGAILIEDGRITKIGLSDSVEAPAEATVLDVRGKTIIPGFIDSHAHLTQMRRDLLDENSFEPLLYLSFGITTVKDPSNGGDHGLAYAELIEAGTMVGPRLFGAEGIVPVSHRIGSEEDAAAIARRTIRLGGTFLKYHSGWDRQQRGWIISAARNAGLNVAAHFAVSNIVPGRLNLTTIVDGATSSEHEFGSVPEFRDVTEFVAQSGTWVNFARISGGYVARYWPELKLDPRIQNFYVDREPRTMDAHAYDAKSPGLPPLEQSDEQDGRVIADIAHAGGNVTIGSHGNEDGVGFHTEMWAHAHAGMSNYDVLRAATIRGAESLGISGDIGSLEVGKIADLLILSKDPLEDIRNTLSVEGVIKDGIVRDSLTLDELWPNHAKLPAWKYEERRRNDIE